MRPTILCSIIAATPLSLQSSLEAWRRRVHPLHQMRRVRAFRALARAIDRPVWTSLYGVSHPVRVYMLRDASYLVNRRSPEPHIAALFLSILRVKPVAFFWDVGANIGYYSWLIASASPATKVLAIEPDPTNLEMLCSSREYVPRVEILEAAVSSKDGTATFARDEVSGATGTLETAERTFSERHYRAQSRPIEVITRTFDSIGLERGFPDLVKIDIEGHEADAACGGTKLFERSPLVVIESFDPTSSALEKLRAAGYRLLNAEALTDATPSDGNYLAIGESDHRLLPLLREEYKRALADAGLTGRHS